MSKVGGAEGAVTGEIQKCPWKSEGWYKWWGGWGRGHCVQPPDSMRVLFPVWKNILWTRKGRKRAQLEAWVPSSVTPSSRRVLTRIPHPGGGRALGNHPVSPLPARSQPRDPSWSRAGASPGWSRRVRPLVASRQIAPLCCCAGSGEETGWEGCGWSLGSRSNYQITMTGIFPLSLLTTYNPPF